MQQQLQVGAGPACARGRAAGGCFGSGTALSHREGLWRLLELSKKPIFIVFESQYREIHHPAITLLKQHRGAVTLLLWRAGSMVRAEQDRSQQHPTAIPALPFVSATPQRSGAAP